MIMTETVVRN